ncbi:MAG: hypothetical protein LBL87_07350 [Ruminococcus sp.]|jgi:hypothetical protein|nr:hypothetical protein [Ruminococcus sp.]
MNVSKYRDFYKTEWNTETQLTDSKLGSFIIRACDNIANALFVLSVDNLNIPQALNDTFCRAVCAETDFLIKKEPKAETAAQTTTTTTTQTVPTSEYDSIQIGSFRMSGLRQEQKTTAVANTAAETAEETPGISNKTQEFLIKTGLLARTINVL